MATMNTDLRNKRAEDFGALFDGGKVVILNDATPIAEFTLASPAFGSPAAGVIAGASLPRNTTGLATLEAESAELHNSDSSYVIPGLSVGVGSGQVQLDSLDVVEDEPLSLTAIGWTESATVS